jgi:hypothetical protein
MRELTSRKEFSQYLRLYEKDASALRKALEGQ